MAENNEDAQLRIRTRTPAPASTSTPTANTTQGGIAPRATAAAPRTAAPAGGSAQGGSWLKTGDAARQAQEREAERNAEKERRRAAGIYMPYRFWVPANKQVEIVLLDDQPGPCMYEHNLQNPATGKYDIYEPCPKEFEACPLCDGIAGGKESYYVMLLTCMVLDPYVNNAGITVPHSRKLLAIKTNDQPFFYRTLEREGSLRGVHLLMARNSKQESSIGRPEMLAKHGEAEIMTTFGHPEVRANDGRVVKQANADCAPFPYAQIWDRPPSAADLRNRYGGAPPMGSPQDMAGASRIAPRGGVGTGPIQPGQTGGSNAGYDDLDDDVPF